MQLEEYQVKRHLEQVSIRKRNRLYMYEDRRRFACQQGQVQFLNPSHHSNHQSQPQLSKTDTKWAQNEEDHSICFNQTNQILFTPSLDNPQSVHNLAEGERSQQDQTRKTPFQFRLYGLKERAYQLYGPKQYPPPFSLPSHYQRQNQDHLIIIDQNFSQVIQETIQQKHDCSHLSEAVLYLQDWQNAQALHRGIIVIRKLLDQNQPGVCFRVLQSGVMPILLRMIAQNKYGNLRLQAGKVLSFIAREKQMECQEAIEAVIDMLQSGEYHFMEAAVELISSLKANQDNSAKLLSGGGLGHIMELAQRTEFQSILINCISAVLNIIAPMNQSNFSYEMEQGCVFLCRVLAVGLLQGQEYQELLYFSVMLLQRMFDLNWSKIARTPVLAYFIRLLTQSSSLQDQIVIEVARLLGAFAEIDESIAQVMLGDGLLDMVHGLLQSKNSQLAEEGLFILNYVAIGDVDHASEVISRSHSLTLCRQFMQSGNPTLSDCACRVFLGVAVLGKHQQVFSCYQKHNIVDGLTYILKTAIGSNVDQLLAALELLHFVLENGQRKVNQVQGKNVFIDEAGRAEGLIDPLLILQDHESQIISKMASRLINDNFQNLIDSNSL